VRAHRRWVVGGLLAVGAVALALPIAAGGRSAADNRSRAEAEAPRLLGLIRLPPNASRSATEPSGDNGVLATPTYNEATPNLIDAHAWWTVPGQAAGVLAYVAAHIPRGARRFMSGSGNAAPGYAVDSWTLSPIAGVVSERVIAVTVVQLNRNTTGVRADGEAIWIVPRPAWEAIPAGVRKALIRAASEHVPAGRRLLDNGSYTLTGADARRLASVINRLALVQPGVFHCPAGFSAHVYLRFLSATGHTLARAVESPTGCASVTLTLGGRRGPPLLDYPSVTSELQRLLRH
jgi:hypothetical protein